MKEESLTQTVVPEDHELGENTVDTEECLVFDESNEYTTNNSEETPTK
jgi:hypothetical protein